MCFYYDGDGSYPYREKVVVRARKQHRCEECSVPIKPGDTYRYVTGRYEGDWFEMRFCAHCDFIRHVIASVERARGCAEDEAWPPSGNLAGDWSDGDYARDLGLYDPSDDDAEPPTFWDLPRW